MVEPPDYSEGIDFRKLAAQDEDFGKIWKKWNGRMEWKDAESLIALTAALLKRDFNRELQLPTDRLCPPVPQRYAYIRWIQLLIDSTGPSYVDAYEPDREVIGLDIGTGASCIYPLLGTATRPHWNFYGTDIDQKSFSYAKSNVQINNLSDRIHLTLISDTDNNEIIPMDRLGIDQKVDFVMCNPPFFTSEDDMMATWTNKADPPSAICTGATVEMITPGGDFGFAKRMANESRKHQKRVQWYTCMLGKLQSVVDLVNHLKDIDCGNWVVGTLVAGNRTRRWVVGWSWDTLRPINEVARCILSIKQILPPSTEISIRLNEYSMEYISSNVNKIISALEVSWTWNERYSQGILKTSKNVWSRSARRQALHNRKNDREIGPVLSYKGSGSLQSITDDDVTGDRASDQTKALIIKVTIKREGEIHLRWVKGQDFIMFESFSGWLKRQSPICRPLGS